MTVSICWIQTLLIGRSTAAAALRPVEDPQEAPPLLIRVPGLMLKDEAGELMHLLPLLLCTPSSSYRETQS